MGLDINAIKAKLNKLQNKNGKTANLWKPSEGKQTVRILPYKETPENPFIEMFFHYDFNGKTLVSPRSYGLSDPIYDFSMNLRKTGDKESYQQSKKFEPKMRTHVPVLVRGEESEGIKYWAFGKLVYEQLLGYIADPDYGDITDIKEGRDIVVEFEKPETGYPKTTIRVKPNPSLAFDDAAKLKSMFDEQIIVSDIYEAKTVSELELELTAYLNADDDSITDGTATSDNAVKVNEEAKTAAELRDDSAPFKSGVVQQSTTAPKKQITSDVEDAFDSLFNS